MFGISRYIQRETHGQKVETNTMAVNFSDGSGTESLITLKTHEEIMFSPLVAEVAKVLDCQESKKWIIKEDSEEDTVVAGGPVVRNGIIMASIRNRYEEWKNSGTDKENKVLKNVLDMMIKEYNSAAPDDVEIDGIAMFILGMARLTKGMAYGLIIFHKGSTLFLETLSKKKMRHSWEEPVGKTEMLNIMDLKEAEAIKKKLKVLGLRKLKSVLGRDKIFPSSDFTFFIPQDPDVFSHFGDEKHDEYCWLCHVTVRKLKKSICAGCLVARYCTLGCQEEDWSRHRDYCMMKKARREEKTLSKMRKKVFIAWEKEVD